MLNMYSLNNLEEESRVHAHAESGDTENVRQS